MYLRTLSQEHAMFWYQSFLQASRPAGHQDEIVREVPESEYTQKAQAARIA